ncbi:MULTISPECIES: Fe-S cluster assembly protein SufD [unclassified Corynebacterium]|uniref:Fe-S cluster assembly protein SufD n=1 Tax=Corynebacterium TaxID=1716 RepID=UPI00254E7BD1|nr:MULTISPECIES: Fe-S cluster assembly protein SufD [unclassified Corynebacterium]MDK8452216.1 Fe-S cluster assembly protein SufD [Corynebacterium sp. MSK084]MDK8466471.1 Fe-S cluster assembly protein SufD [Corynebacterium sp. MSK130]MDK8475365.1 Fe-S cluster assembly protein SufD [Corynebacterium sp. MSK310]MDK8492181.1 Fe-S cluster assembly protein SufD [Corynebacterium sp. MSK175]MDK8514153.1 Fe-S cluster assembly protein SufD [Corynebacterium sp. MSK123]
MVASNEFNPDKITKGDVFTSTNVEDFPVPHGRDEVWRFVSLRKLRGLHNGEFAQAVAQDVKVSEHPGVSAETVSRDDERLGRVGKPSDRVAAQAWTSMPEGQVVTVEPEVQVEDPITITYTGKGEDVTSFGATSIEVGHHAEATVVLKYAGSGTHADNVEFILGDGAHLTVIVDVDWENDAVHLSNQVAQVGRDAVLRHNSAIFGGEVVRIVPRVNFTAPGGDAELLGVYFADSGQYFENRMLVDHSVPNCRSNVLYKGALQGEKKNEARTCWVGDVLIRSNAQGTDTYETNNNLILTDGARADAIPNLEIETGEITGAGHAATVGRFDDIELFYLMSRGIPEAEARRLIIRGFFNEVIHRIPVQSLSEELENRISEELEKISA